MVVLMSRCPATSWAMCGGMPCMITSVMNSRHYAVLGAVHPGCVRLQKGAGGAGVHCPPAPHPSAGVIPRAASLALRAPPERPRVGPHRYHQDLIVDVLVNLCRHLLDDHALAAQ